MEKLDIFIPGETIDLCIPTREFARDSDWYSWVNDRKINKYLYQGLFPNTREKQLEFFESQKDSRIILIVSNRKDYLGIISLSNIDLVTKKASVAIVINPEIDFFNSPIIAMEALARITEHGFTAMALNRISAGQHIKLAGWQKRMELLGYRVEGINRDEFVRGRDVADAMSVAATYVDYLKIIDQRGKYWDSADKMKKRIESLPKNGFVDKLSAFFKEEGNTYYKKILRL